MSGNRPRQSHEWLDAPTDRLRVLWAEGLGTREIGVELGVGKNAVIGKARRLGLAPRPSPLGLGRGQPLPPPRPRPVPSLYRQLEPQQRSSLAGRPPAPPATPPTPPQPPQAPQGSGGTCQWILNDGRPWRFCEAVAAPGRPYCLVHAALAYHLPSRHRLEGVAA